MKSYGKITIRKATKSDEKQLAKLAYEAYVDRFFNPEVTDKYGASLTVYPELIPNEEKDTGQSYSTFKDYWKNAIQNLDNEEKQFLCFVAELENPNGKEIIGFRKGYATSLDDVEYQRYQRENKKRNLIRKRNNYYGITTYDDLREIPLPPKEKIAGSSSLYISPKYKRTGVGHQLIQEYAREVIKLGFDGMMTSCYIKNDSQKFLKAQGGDFFIYCDIPVTYKNEAGKTKICNISGLMCLWDKKSLNNLANGYNNPILKNNVKTK